MCQLALRTWRSFTLTPSTSICGPLNSVKTHLKAPRRLCLGTVPPFFLQRADKAASKPEATPATNTFNIPSGSSHTSHLEQALPHAHITHTLLKSPAEKANVICPCIK